ncbi:MAG: TlpA disulfide reductase family protein [Halanaerobacter sp.]
MNKKFKVGLIVILVLMIIGLGLYYQLNKPSLNKEAKEVQGEVGIEVNNIAPDFELTNLDGERVSLSDYRGKYLLLNFWATWCPPCRREMPDLNEFHKENKDDFVVLAVNLGGAKEKVSKFIDDGSYIFPVLLDENKEVGDRYNIASIPTSYFIGPQGKIQDIKKGAITKTELDKIKEKIQK